MVVKDPIGCLMDLYEAAGMHLKSVGDGFIESCNLWSEVVNQVRKLKIPEVYSPWHAKGTALVIESTSGSTEDITNVLNLCDIYVNSTPRCELALEYIKFANPPYDVLIVSGLKAQEPAIIDCLDSLQQDVPGYRRPLLVLANANHYPQELVSRAFTTFQPNPNPVHFAHLINTAVKMSRCRREVNS
jgi:hypothetical protein